VTGALTLAIEASTYAGSVALVRDRDVVAERELAMRDQRSERLLPAVAALLVEVGVSTTQLERIVCGAGPGSFTSLRLAASIAKGIALGAGRPLFGVSSLLLTVAGAPGAAAPGRYLAALEAMRGEAFVAGYEVTAAGPIVEIFSQALVPAGSVDALARQLEARVVGPGRSLDCPPNARGVARLSDWIERSSAADLVSWEPDYGRLPEAQARWEAAHRQPLPGS